VTSHYYVTGTSRGLGRALVEALLESGDARVTGLGRSAGPLQENYRQVGLDLSELAAVAAFRFPPHAAPDRVVLVNNAAVFTPTYLSEETPESIRQSYAINIVAPVLLMRAFLAAYQDSGAELIVCNLSSGSARNPAPGASLYSGTKAALEITSRVLAQEAEATGIRLTVLCVNPGSVDTAMQETLRSADETKFPYATLMRQRKAEGGLQSPGDVARRLVRLLNEPSLAPDGAFDLSDMPD
jgi:benzil reductase ((S)-benzoin forming)